MQITTGVPRGNGQVERVHRIIISVLTKLSIDAPDRWYKHVREVQRAINCTYQRSIGKTPFEVMFGTEMRNTTDLNLQELIEEEKRLAFEENRDNLRKSARETILKIQQENSRTYNKKRKKAHLYKEGDLVAIKRTQFGIGLKMRVKYLGPYQVIAARGKDRYEVSKIDDEVEGPNNTTSSADNMKPWAHLSESDMSEADI